MTSFNIVIEEKAKESVLAELNQLTAEKRIGTAVATGMKAIVESLPGTQVALAFNGSDEPSGYVYASWQSHSDVRDVPTEEERMMDDATRLATMATRLKRQPRL